MHQRCAASDPPLRDVLAERASTSLCVHKCARWHNRNHSIRSHSKRSQPIRSICSDAKRSDAMRFELTFRIAVELKLERARNQYGRQTGAAREMEILRPDSAAQVPKLSSRPVALLSVNSAQPQNPPLTRPLLLVLLVRLLPFRPRRWLTSRDARRRHLASGAVSRAIISGRSNCFAGTERARDLE